jgi:hypothetical protein
MGEVTDGKVSRRARGASARNEGEHLAGREALEVLKYADMLVNSGCPMQANAAPVYLARQTQSRWKRHTKQPHEEHVHEAQTIPNPTNKRPWQQQQPL